MVLLFITELAVESSLWVIKKTCDYGYYLIYGETETKEDKILKQIEEIKKQNEIEKKKLEQELEEIKKKINK